LKSTHSSSMPVSSSTPSSRKGFWRREDAKMVSPLDEEEKEVEEGKEEEER